MRHAWFWATVFLVIIVLGACGISIGMRALFGDVSLLISMPVCGAWGGLGAWVGFRLAYRQRRGE